MPIFQAFLLFLLLVGISIPGQVQAQDPATDDPVQATSNDVPARQLERSLHLSRLFRRKKSPLRLSPIP